MNVAEPTRPPEMGPTMYGAGRAIGSYRGHEMAHHGGFVPGQVSKFLRIPGAGVALGIMSNDQTWGEPLVSSLARRVPRDLLGLDPADWETRAIEEMWERSDHSPSPRPRANPMADPAPAPGEGTFTHPRASP